MNADQDILSQLELDYELLDSGCCGMAGSFGFHEGDSYEVSIQCGERVLLPAVRNAPADTLIMADGFSCREQIAQTTTRRALHLAQVLHMALSEGPDGPEEPLPEINYITYALIFDKGEEFLAGLEQFAGQQNLIGSHFTAIGAFSDVILAFFDRESKEYEEIWN